MHKLNTNRYYQHKNSLGDACILIHNSYQVSSKRCKVKATWYNLGFMGQPWSLTMRVPIDIKNTDEWVDVTHKVYVPRV